VFALIATFAFAGLVPWYAKRRPVGTPLTWGEAMAAALFVFFLMFLAWGIMPHQWLNYADNKLQWRKDKILVGPGTGAYKVTHFTITYEALRDVIAAGLYGVTLGGMIALWGIWQSRGQEKPKELPTSSYGRPLVKKA
jgi:hypothetical protein